MKYTISREENGEFKSTGEIFDTGDVSPDDANAAAQDRIEQLQAENGGCYAAQIIAE